MNAETESLERATLDAVAPPNLQEIPGWLLPMDHSTIGRAISAVPLRHSGIDSADIPIIETIYSRHQHQARFRVADVPGLNNVRDELSARGYLPRQATLTQVAAVRQLLPGSCDDNSLKVCISEQPHEDWQSVYLSAGFDPQDSAHRVAALSRSQCVMYAWLCDSEGPAAAGTASLSRGWMGLHGLRTSIRARGRGHAKRLIEALSTHAQQRGLSQCYLQVADNNQSAISLYRGLGFQTAWLYHYWVRD